MRAVPLAIPEVVLIEPKVHRDARGYFLESWERRKFAAIGIDRDFVQDNHSGSVHGVLRGLHYQIEQPQGKLVRVIEGEVYDVAVDLRRSSPSYGRWVGATLSATGMEMLWIPPGFAHGFLVLSASAQFVYKCTDYYAPGADRCLRWDDRTLAIDWPLDRIDGPVKLSDKDAGGAAFAVAETYP
jgi:dTDP-4-dehydrorhamnose 3,5-epimerase